MKDTAHDMLVEIQGNVPDDFEELRALVEGVVLEYDFKDKQAETLAEVRTTTSRLRLIQILYLPTIKGHGIKQRQEMRKLTA